MEVSVGMDIEEVTGDKNPALPLLFLGCGLEVAV